MLGTMKDLADREAWEDEFGEGELTHIPDDDVLDPERATELALHQLDTQKLIKKCEDEIEASFEAASRSSREQDLVGWLAEEMRREHIQGYLKGLKRLDSVIGNLVEATSVTPHIFTRDEHSRERYRQHAVDRIARINEGLLRRHAQKNTGGREN